MAENKYINRDLSWLQFNARVLQEATDVDVPLIERLRFLGIFSNNLDEFFRVRYASIKRIEMAGKKGRKVLGGFTANELLGQITKVVIDQQAESIAILSEIEQKLQEHQVFMINEDQATEAQGDFLKNYFLEKVSPALVNIMLNDLEALPPLKDSAAYLAVKLVLSADESKEEDHQKRYLLIEIPKGIERFVVLPEEDGKIYIMMLDDLIRYNFKTIFNIFDYESISAHMIKITRDAEIEMSEDFSQSYLEKLTKGVKDRSDGDPVRFVYDQTIDTETLDFLMSKMRIDNKDSIIPGGRYHNKRDYMGFPSLGKKELLYEEKPPLEIPNLIIQTSLFSQIKKKDFLQYVPYQTFRYTVKFLREAALDPKVTSIKITLYRIATISHIASSLTNAAKNGKDVTVSIELQARFDEANNIMHAERLQKSGVKVIFGVPGLKVHAKACVIERREEGKLRRYGFISTGNFNESTARVYTDYTLFTANKSICRDIDKVFSFFEINYRIRKFKHLIVSPHYTRDTLNELIDNEIQAVKNGKIAGISLKLNSLSDYKMIDKLYEASTAGVNIKLIVRGICSLIPGVPGMSENIEAISIVDKYLEHPRLYIFENWGNKKVYISSADFMTRNLDRRVEIACPIYDEDIKEELIETFTICWNDTVKARDLASNGQVGYRRLKNKPRLRSQFATYDYYVNKLKAASLKS